MGVVTSALSAENALAVCAVGQAAFYHQRDLHWAEIDYYLQVRQVHIDTLNNLRDLYEMDQRKIDNGMIVTTLMLSIRFGFVVEGTFPPTPEDGETGQHAARYIYAGVAALSLICPFWSMCCLIESKRRLDFFMDRFTHEFYAMLKQRIDGFVQESSDSETIRRSTLVRYTENLPG